MWIVLGVHVNRIFAALSAHTKSSRSLSLKLLLQAAFPLCWLDGCWLQEFLDHSRDGIATTA